MPADRAAATSVPGRARRRGRHDGAAAVSARYGRRG